MKKEELDLTKAHVDQFKSDPKSYSGEKLVLTTAGWATVTQDGTIAEVLDAFPASQEDIFQQLISRGEVESSPSLNENDLINAIDIGLNKNDSLNDSSDKNGELTTRERISGQLTVALDQVNGIDIVSGDNSSKVGNWIEGSSFAIDTGVFVSGGRPPYTYKWQLSNRDVTFVDFTPAKDQATINISQRNIANTLGIPTVNGEFTLTCTVEDQEENSNLVAISVLFIGE